MTPTTSPNLGQIHALLAERGYEVTEPAPDTLTHPRSGKRSLHPGGLEGDILFFSLPCITVPRARVTPEIMANMLAADNGISTSSFQLYDAGGGKVTVTLNNFCKLQDMGPDDEDDILSCVHFLLVDVMTRAAPAGRPGCLGLQRRYEERRYGILIGYFRPHRPRGPRPGQRRRRRPRRRHLRSHGAADRGRHEDRVEQGGARLAPWP